METYYLAHHGVTGMKWGVMHGPPYPLARTSDGRLNSRKQAARKRSYGSMSFTINGKSKAEIQEAIEAKKALRAENKAKRQEERAARKLLREQQEAQKKAEQEAAEAAQKKLAEDRLKQAEASEREALKQYVRHHPREISKYADLFTNEEMEEIVSRINLDRKVKDIRDDEYRRYQKYADDAVKALQTVSTAAETAIKIYNSTASVWNAIGQESYDRKNRSSDDDKFHPLPRVGGNKDQGGEKKQNPQNSGNQQGNQNNQSGQNGQQNPKKKKK